MAPNSSYRPGQLSESGPRSSLGAAFALTGAGLPRDFFFLFLWNIYSPRVTSHLSPKLFPPFSQPAVPMEVTGRAGSHQFSFSISFHI